MASAFAALLLGLVLGMRHATDADHVVAVTTIVSRERSIRSAGVIGAAWGVGHTLTILLVGGAIILFSIAIPPRLGLAMEFSVALMLIVLGAANLLGLARGLSQGVHGHDHGPPQLRRLPLARSLMVGTVHGLAGSAGVTLLVLATIHEPRWALLYLLLFGGGTVVGMMLLTSVIAVPFALAADRFGRVNRLLVQITSLVSISLGLFLAHRIGVADGLFSASPHWMPG